MEQTASIYRRAGKDLALFLELMYDRSTLRKMDVRVDVGRRLLKGESWKAIEHATGASSATIAIVNRKLESELIKEVLMGKKWVRENK